MGTGPFFLCTKSKNLMQGTEDFTDDVRKQRMASPHWVPPMAAPGGNQSRESGLCPQISRTPREEEAGNRDKKARKMNRPIEAGRLMVESPELSPS